MTFAQQLAAHPADARWVAAGVGLPPVFRTVAREWYLGMPTLPADQQPLDLTDMQTAFGVALKLDEWEDWDDGGGADLLWTERVAAVAWCWTSAQARMLREDLAARVIHIGQDHHIRRALGWEVEPGTLATFQLIASPGETCWCLSTTIAQGRGLHHFSDSPPRVRKRETTPGHIPALAGITDPVEALRLIAEAL